MSTTLSEKRAAAGSKGGQATVKRHGKEYMAEIGRRGAQKFHDTYRLEPVYLNDFAIRHRKTGKTVALLSGRPVQEGE